MSDILLINPPAGERGPINLACPPHLGLSYIAAVALEAGYGVSILDYGFGSYDSGRLRDALRGGKPKLVGVSVASPSLREASAIARDVKAAAPDAVLVLGGPHVSADPALVCELGVDYGFCGEADYGFRMLCDYVTKDEGDLAGIPGLVYGRDGIPKSNKPGCVEDLDGLPDPALHVHSFTRNEGIPVSTSRGCPFDCTYCTQARSMKVRYRSPDRIVEEVAALARSHDARFFSFIDDVFTLDRSRTLALCRLLKQRLPKVRWSAITRADCVDRELLSAMKDAGCRHLSFGVESGVEEIRYRLKKRVSNEDYVKAFSLCKRLGIRSCAYAMMGLPGERWEDMEATTRFVKNLHPTYGFFKTTVLMPSSSLFAQALKEDKIHSGVWREFMRGRAAIPYYVPNGLTLADVEFARTRAVKGFYLRAGFARDHLTAGCGVGETLGLMRLALDNPDCFS